MEPHDWQAGVKPSWGPHAAARSKRAESSPLRCLPSKLRPPRPHVELVTRDALVATLLKSTEPLVLVSAPAGSGKTVSLTQWLHVETRPAIWLRLDGDDNDPLVLLRCLAVALDQVLGVDPEVLELLQLRSPPLVERVLPGLAATVAGARPFVLVIDDAQLVQKQESWAHLELVLENLPEGAQLVVATRSDPPLPLGRLRARGELLEVRFEELAFDDDEALQLLRLQAAGEGSVDDDARDTVAALLEATEGWATGLYLAALTARGRSPSEWLPEVRGDQRAIADYLLGEVLERQPAELQRFLLETAILDELTAPLCAAVTGRADAGAVLARLARKNLFVSALDDRDERYRYHHLFADLLRSRLERLEPARPPQLHRLAAAWYEAHDEPEPAIRHYLAAGDVAATVGLTEATIDTMLSCNLQESARRLVGLYTEEQLLAHPALAISAGWVYASVAERREQERRWARLMQELDFEDGPSATGAASLRSSWLCLMGDLGRQGLGQMRRAFEEALRLEIKSGDWRDIATDGVASCHYFSGSPEPAERMWRELSRGTTFAGMALAPAWNAAIPAQLALIAADAGRWGEAEKLQTEAVTLCPRMGLDETHHSVALPMLLAHLRLMSHRGDAETIAFAWTIDDFMKDMQRNPPYVLLESYVLLGEVALEQGELVDARGWCDRALKALAEWPDAGMFGRRAKQLRDALDRRVMAEPITPAEQRVLELLPTHLTVAHLAERLYLAPATVKAHLRAIYRKLEVGTREEAVARAREIGLLKR
jgi:LuxR family maltose regulon positive regulatory protein